MREEWKYKKLGEVCTIKAGYTPQKNELSDNGAYPYYKVADMNTLGNDVYLDITSSYKIDANKLFPKGAIVFPKNGAAVSTNKKRILKYDSIVDLNTGVAIFPKSINEKFAYYWFIDGELITKASTGGKWTVTNIADNGNTSSMSCIFNSYGKREIKCEIVYIPNVSQGDKLIRYVGGD